MSPLFLRTQLKAPGQLVSIIGQVMVDLAEQNFQSVSVSNLRMDIVGSCQYLKLAFAHGHTKPLMDILLQLETCVMEDDLHMR